MILRLTCPKCNKDSYCDSADTYKPCPYCGIQFSGRLGTDKRNDNRIEKEIHFSLSYNGQNLKASTLNISQTGLSIRIFGNTHLPVGSIIDLIGENINIRAKIVWVINNPYLAVATTGLKILDGDFRLSRLDSIRK